ncbi:MaoC/PaaZ C-terminal domain-containing protein [Saccharothrix coeruleofusca]|uniref:MaoC-like domain-containing protein n=1 Tax=Saccharothrix coeruleofusca TaxID=33919 RepID=A0A918AK50_9PSEU|nr:MaoC/PaaZ C-terminal domain-containing protein [Saccharothrix coeruleofusca]GGP39443.1 hypothetical protein GCM10010185_08740 [Saccharothrix coeruleofusca]
MAGLTWLYAKAAVTAPAKRGDTSSDALPDAVLTAGAEVDRAHLAAYGRVCGFGVRDELPPTYPHVLAFPLHVELMTGADFPFPLPGLVHVANRITRTRPLLASEPLELVVRAENLRPHERGRQFDVVTTASVDGEAVWVDVSTYLRRSSGPSSGTSGGTGGGTGGAAGERPQPPRPTASWRVPADTGRRYAAVSGDRNPIHLHPLAARAFGFPRAIAHGMWTKARCLAALAGRLPDACAVDVRFKAPLPLPARADFAARPTADGWRFSVWSGGKPSLEGTVSG